MSTSGICYDDYFGFGGKVANFAPQIMYFVLCMQCSQQTDLALSVEPGNISTWTNVGMTFTDSLRTRHSPNPLCILLTVPREYIYGRDAHTHAAKFITLSGVRPQTKLRRVRAMLGISPNRERLVKHSGNKFFSEWWGFHKGPDAGRSCVCVRRQRAMFTHALRGKHVDVQTFPPSVPHDAPGSRVSVRVEQIDFEIANFAAFRVTDYASLAVHTQHSLWANRVQSK